MDEERDDTGRRTARHHAAAVSPFFGCGWRMAIKGKSTSFTHVRTWIAARASSSSPCSFALGYRFQVHRGPWLSSSRSSSHSSRSTIISITYERIENETICAYVNKMQRPPHTQVVSLITWSSALLDFTRLYLPPRLPPQSDFIPGLGLRYSFAAHNFLRRCHPQNGGQLKEEKR